MSSDLHPNLITGIEEIDIQHLDLFKAMEDFDYKKKSKEALWTVLMQIETYAQIHFETEEKYMKNFEYPLMEEHIAAHRKFVEDYTVLKKELEKIGLSEKFVENLQRFLLDWIFNHYTDIDTKMADFIKKRLNAISQNND